MRVVSCANKTTSQEFNQELTFPLNQPARLHHSWDPERKCFDADNQTELNDSTQDILNDSSYNCGEVSMRRELRFGHSHDYGNSLSVPKLSLWRRIEHVSVKFSVNIQNIPTDSSNSTQLNSSHSGKNLPYFLQTKGTYFSRQNNLRQSCMPPLYAVHTV